MKKTSLIPLFLATALAGSGGLVGAEEIKIGFSAPLTGAQAMYGKDLQNGVILALEEFNASKPKIGGKDIKLVLLSEDDQADPRIGTQIAQKMVH